MRTSSSELAHGLHVSFIDTFKLLQLKPLYKKKGELRYDDQIYYYVYFSSFIVPPPHPPFMALDTGGMNTHTMKVDIIM